MPDNRATEECDSDQSAGKDPQTHRLTIRQHETPATPTSAQHETTLMRGKCQTAPTRSNAYIATTCETNSCDFPDRRPVYLDLHLDRASRCADADRDCIIRKSAHKIRAGGHPNVSNRTRSVQRAITIYLPIIAFPSSIHRCSTNPFPDVRL